MLTIDCKKEMRDKAFQYHKIGKTIGFVPTMGYLHEGHLNLVRKAKEISDIVVVSIYVNPTQFGEGEDFSRYPRDHERDIRLLEMANTDIVFLPKEQSMYNHDHLTWVKVEKMSDLLCGRSRKGHFRGVATIVLKLLNIVTPNLLFMGEKDYQQIVILEKMIDDLDLPVRIIRCPTIREKDGLAMSSRNSYLSVENRRNATALHQALLRARELYRQGMKESKKVISEIGQYIEARSGNIDYIDVIDSNTLSSIPQLKEGCRLVLAVFFEGTRLIDNIEIS
jgi:pantoate--beta-alanine ligase